MYILFYITLLLLITYGILIEYYRRAWNNIPSFNLSETENGQDNTKVTVIIPARNEEKNIVICLESLLKQTYSKELLEIIVVNDHSTDKTEEAVQGFTKHNIKLINLSDYIAGIKLNSYKKKAIEIAITQSSGELIITTDADCIAPPGWIKSIASLHNREQAAFIAAPVKIIDQSSLLSVFQSLDFISLQGITGASVHKKIHAMCNGANLAYEKQIFYEVEGFRGIDRIASGDDMLLMHKICKKYPDRIFFLKSKDAIVSTQPMATWSTFFNQRVRWASKADKYDDKRIFWTLLLVYLLNFCILIFLAGSIWNVHWLFFFFGLIAGKTVLEFWFVKTIADFFEQKHLIKYFFFLQPLHMVYTVIAGWLGKFGSYQWKDRKVK